MLANSRPLLIQGKAASKFKKAAKEIIMENQVINILLTFTDVKSDFEIISKYAQKNADLPQLTKIQANTLYLCPTSYQINWNGPQECPKHFEIYSGKHFVTVLREIDALQVGGSQENEIGSQVGLRVGAAGGAILGTVVCPGVGTAVGAIVGGVVGFVVGYASDLFTSTKPPLETVIAPELTKSSESTVGTFPEHMQERTEELRNTLNANWTIATTKNTSNKNNTQYNEIALDFVFTMIGWKPEFNTKKSRLNLEYATYENTLNTQLEIFKSQIREQIPNETNTTYLDQLTKIQNNLITIKNTYVPVSPKGGGKIWKYTGNKVTFDNGKTYKLYTNANKEMRIRKK